MLLRCLRARTVPDAPVPGTAGCDRLRVRVGCDQSWECSCTRELGTAALKAAVGVEADAEVTVRGPVATARRISEVAARRSDDGGRPRIGWIRSSERERDAVSARAVELIRVEGDVEALAGLQACRLEPAPTWLPALLVRRRAP